LLGTCPEGREDMKETDNIPAAEAPPEATEARTLKCDPCNGYGYRWEMGWVPSFIDNCCRVCWGRGVVDKK
jgi:hypothetical protein